MVHKEITPEEKIFCSVRKKYIMNEKDLQSEAAHAVTSKKVKKIAVLTSGGDAPGMNAAVRAVTRCGLESDMQVFGVYRGYEGLIEGEFLKMERRLVSDIMQRGGTILKTARSDRFETEEGQERAVSMIHTFGIDALIVIGGDGTMRGAADLSNFDIPVICLPGTIDNDLGYTDFTIGFDTAVNTVLEAIGKIRDTSSSHERTTVIEVMGRRCGDIAVYAGLSGGAEMVCVPEMPVDVNRMCNKIITDGHNGRTHSVIIVAEGAPIRTRDLVEEIRRKTGKEVRQVVLSYLQRGGSPTSSDRLLGTLCGAKAVEILADPDFDMKSYAVGQRNGKIIATHLNEALEMRRDFKEELVGLINVLSK